MNFVPYAIPFFILALLAEFVYAQMKGRHAYRLNDTVSSLSMGTLSRLRGVLQIGLGAAAFEALLADAALLTMGTDSAAAWVAAFVLYDLCYYFSHRYGHEWRILWAAHAAHHQSEEFNLSTALRQTSTGGLNAVFYIPLYLIGFPAEMLVSVGSLNLIYQFWVHTEHVRRLGPLDYILVTPSNHRVHHAKNPCYIDRNYGGVFILWDRLFGTFTDEREDEPCVYGITRQLASWNPLWANAHVYAEGLSDMRHASRFRDKVALWFKGPGWRPEGVPEYAANWRAPKYDPPADPTQRWYAFVQFAVHVPVTLALLAADFTNAQTLCCAALLAFGFYTQGAYMEGRPYATWLELARAAGCAAMAGWLAEPVIAVYALITGTAALTLQFRRGPAAGRLQ